METIVQETPTLKQMRESAGLSTREAARRLAEYLGEAKRSHVSILKIEMLGTNKEDVTDALASVYGVSVEDLRAASKRLRRVV